MVEPITVHLTTWQATITTITMLVAMLNLAWTICSKVEDWKIAKADKEEKKQSEARNNLSTADKLASYDQRIAELEKKLATASKDYTNLDNKQQKSIYRLVENQGRMNAHLKELEKNQCKCNLTKSKDVDPLAVKLSEVDAATMKLSTDIGNATTTIQQLQGTISTIKSCHCHSSIPHPTVPVGSPRKRVPRPRSR